MKKKLSKDGVFLFNERLERLQSYQPEVRYKIFDAIINYKLNGELPTDPMVEALFQDLKSDMDEAMEKKQRYAESRKNNGSKRWNKQEEVEMTTGLLKETVIDKEEEDFAELMDNLTTPTLSEDAEKVLEMYNAPYTQGYAQHSWEMKHKVLDKVFPSMSTADKDDIIIELDNYLRTKEIA